MNLIEEKAKLQGQLDAISLLEGLDQFQLAAIKEVLNAAPSSDMVECDVCGEYFKRSGIKRHKSVSH